MKYEKELEEIKKAGKVYFTFLYWDNYARRLCPFTYTLLSSREVVEKIYEKLPSVLNIEIKYDNDYPYPLVRASL